jgi:uncharacterized delta-60 repeat protein
VLGLSSVADITVQPDGKIIAAGTPVGSTESESAFGVIRLNPDGTLDPTFGTGGLVTFDFAPVRLGAAHALELMTDGRIVVSGGSGGSRFPGAPISYLVARLLPTGELDETFDLDGRAIVPGFATTGVGVSTYSGGMAVDSLGRVVAVASFFGFAADLEVIRLTAAGQLDLAFSDDGRVGLPFFLGPQT